MLPLIGSSLFLPPVKLHKFATTGSKGYGIRDYTFSIQIFSVIYTQKSEQAIITSEQTLGQLLFLGGGGFVLSFKVQVKVEKDTKVTNL